jgi:hypothetical protein
MDCEMQQLVDLWPIVSGVVVVGAVAALKVTLRDLPPVAESHLAGLNNTDDMTNYDPVNT